MEQEREVSRRKQGREIADRQAGRLADKTYLCIFPQKSPQQIFVRRHSVSSQGCFQYRYNKAVIGENRKEILNLDLFSNLINRQEFKPVQLERASKPHLFPRSKGEISL